MLEFVLADAFELATVYAILSITFSGWCVKKGYKSWCDLYAGAMPFPYFLRIQEGCRLYNGVYGICVCVCVCVYPVNCLAKIKTAFSQIIALWLEW